MEHLNEHDHGKAIVDHHGHQIVDGGDERAGGHGGVNVDLVEQHRDHGADQTGNDNGGEERETDAARDQKRICGRIALEQHDVNAQKNERHHAEQRAVAGADLHLLRGQMQLVLRAQIFVHQYADRDRQRLRADVAGHVQNERLEADDDRQHGNNALERADDRGNAHAEKEQDNQPRQALFEAGFQRFVQILLAGQAAQLGVIVAHRIVHGFNDVIRGDDADDAPLFAQHRDGGFGVAAQAIQTRLDLLMRHHNVDIQWGNHDVVWMGAAAGSPICICTVLKTTLAYHNHGMLEDCYGINLRHLQRMAEQFYGNDDLSIWMPHTDAARGPYTRGMLHRCAVMHKAISILMFKLECHVIDRNPDFQMQERDYLRRIDWEKHTVKIGEKEYPLRDTSFPTVDPADPAALHPDEQLVLHKLVQSFRQSEKLQQHVEFLYAKGSVYHIENGNLLYHGAVPMTSRGTFAMERFEGRYYSGRALMDYCDARARRGYYAPEGSAARQSGQDFLWYLWCGKLSPLFGRSAMTTFERLYVEDASTHTEVKDPYYTWYNDEAVCRRILAEFGLPGASHIVNGHVPVREKNGESPIKGGGRLVVIDGGFCRAYHEKTGIAGYTLVYSSRTMSLRTHQPFESAEKAVKDNLDIISQKNILETENHRILVEDTDEGEVLRERVHDLKQLVATYQLGWITETRCEDHIW